MSAQHTSPEPLTVFEGRHVLAVVAHPDDESFGLGAVLAALAQTGASIRVLCLTRGEASTLCGSADLGEVRAHELADAADVLGLEAVTLLDHPDGHLGDVPTSVLDGAVSRELQWASAVVVFEPGGVTGHPDHIAATASASRVAEVAGVPTLEWGVAPHVAKSLNDEFATSFVGLDGVDLPVDRTIQLAAIACHVSQSQDNPVLRRRLGLQGDLERVRVVVPPVRR